MAHKKAGGSSRNGRDSNSKRLGVKAFGNEFVKAGSIIIRQRGTKMHPGENVGMGKDHTLFAKTDGRVNFTTKGALKRKLVNILPVWENFVYLKPYHLIGLFCLENKKWNSLMKQQLIFMREMVEME